MDEGRRTAKTQAVCLELGPLCSILGFPLPTQPSPSPPPTAGVIRGVVQAYLTFSICKLLTFSGLKCSISLYFTQTLPRNAKLARGYQKHRDFALNTRGALKLRRFSSPDVASLKCYAFLRPTPKRAAAPWGVGERDRQHFRLRLSTFSPLMSFFKEYK